MHKQHKRKKKIFVFPFSFQLKKRGKKSYRRKEKFIKFYIQLIRNKKIDVTRIQQESYHNISATFSKKTRQIDIKCPPGHFVQFLVLQCFAKRSQILCNFIYQRAKIHHFLLLFLEIAFFCRASIFCPLRIFF